MTTGRHHHDGRRTGRKRRAAAAVGSYDEYGVTGAAVDKTSSEFQEL